MPRRQRLNRPIRWQELVFAKRQPRASGRRAPSHFSRSICATAGRRPRAEIEARHELCEDVALHAAAFLAACHQEGDDTSGALRRCHDGLRADPEAFAAVEAAWVVRRVAEPQEWAAPAWLADVDIDTDWRAAADNQSIRRQREGARSSAENHFGCRSQPCFRRTSATRACSGGARFRVDRTFPRAPMSGFDARLRF